jgi:hypothetical protein
VNVAPFDEYRDFAGGIAAGAMYRVLSCVFTDPIFDPKIRRELLDNLFNLLNRKRPIRAATIGSRIIRRDLIFRPPDDGGSRYGNRPASGLTNTPLAGFVVQ